MGRAVRAELLKLFTTRLWWGMAIGVALSSAVFAVLFGFLYTSDVSLGGPGGGESARSFSTPEQIANTVYTAGLSVGYLLLLTIGVMQIGMEYRHKTISSTFLTLPRRARAMGAKVVALLVIGAGYGALSVVASVIPGAVVLILRDADPFPTTGILRTLLLMLLVLGLWALIGLGVGILIPNQIAALLIAVGVAWIVEPLLGFALSAWDVTAKWVAPIMPSEATQAVLNVAPPDADRIRLDWWAAALVLIAWSALLAGVGTLRTMRQDIS